MKGASMTPEVTLTEDERRIVEWLREEIERYPGTEFRRHVQLIKYGIERGEHRQR